MSSSNSHVNSHYQNLLFEEDSNFKFLNKTTNTKSYTCFILTRDNKQNIVTKLISICFKSISVRPIGKFLEKQIKIIYEKRVTKTRDRKIFSKTLSKINSNFSFSFRN